jgi:UDP-N-acetylglucosamine--N-acetylmuramyl-(pentapeptide) pyrophosphoryl-undecaprenol N-acetylglucosamine transferase
LKPDVVVGFGGYPSVPCALAAQALRIKTIIHEQNAVIGLANKLLSKMATKILTSFPQTIGIRDSPKVIRVGNPTRFENRYGAVGKPSNRVFTILIFGGSQGSMVFAKVIPPVVRELAKSFPIKVFHQCQVEAIEDLRQTYSTHGISHLVSGFFDNIGELYEEADLVISRAGASSVSEIIGFQKPSILIPFKNSINGDQKANAEFLQTRNAAFVIDETDELGAKLKTLIESVASDKSKLTSIADALRSLRLADCTLNMKRIVTKEALGF